MGIAMTLAPGFFGVIHGINYLGEDYFESIVNLIYANGLFRRY